MIGSLKMSWLWRALTLTVLSVGALTIGILTMDIERRDMYVSRVMRVNDIDYVMKERLTYPTIRTSASTIKQSNNQTSNPSNKRYQTIRDHYDAAMSTIYEYSIDQSSDQTNNHYIDFQINRPGEFEYSVNQADQHSADQSIDHAKKRLRTLISQPPQSMEQSIYRTIYQSLDHLQFHSSCDRTGRYLVYDWINEYSMINPSCRSGVATKRPTKRANKIVSIRDLKEKAEKKKAEKKKAAKQSNDHSFSSLFASDLSSDCALSPLLDLIRALMIAQSSDRQLVIRPINQQICQSIAQSINQTNLEAIYRMIYPLWDDQAHYQATKQPVHPGLAASLSWACNFDQLLQPISQCSYQSVSQLIFRYGYHEDPFYGTNQAADRSSDQANGFADSPGATPVALYLPLSYCHLSDDLFRHTLEQLPSINQRTSSFSKQAHAQSNAQTIGRLAYFQGLTNFVLNPQPRLIKQSKQLEQSIIRSVARTHGVQSVPVMTLYNRPHPARPLFDELSLDRTVQLLRDQSIMLGINQIVLWLDESKDHSNNHSAAAHIRYADIVQQRLPGTVVHLISPTIQPSDGYGSSSDHSLVAQLGLEMSKLLVCLQLSAAVTLDTDTAVGLLINQAVNSPVVHHLTDQIGDRSTESPVSPSAIHPSTKHLTDIHNDHWYHDCPAFSYRLKIVQSSDNSFRQTDQGINLMRTFSSAERQNIQLTSAQNANIVSLYPGEVLPLNQMNTESSPQSPEQFDDQISSNKQAHAQAKKSSIKPVTLLFLLGLDHQEIAPLQQLFHQLAANQSTEHANQPSSTEVSKLFTQLFGVPQTVDQYAQTRDQFIRTLEQSIQQSIDQSIKSVSQSSRKSNSSSDIIHPPSQVIRIDWSPTNVAHPYRSITRPRIGVIVRMIDRLIDRYPIRLKILVATRSFPNAVYQSLNQTYNQSNYQSSNYSNELLYTARVLRDQTMALMSDLKSIDQTVIQPIAQSIDDTSQQMVFQSIHHSVYQLVNMDELDDYSIDQSVNALKIASSISQLDLYQPIKQWLMTRSARRSVRPSITSVSRLSREQQAVLQQLSINLFIQSFDQSLTLSTNLPKTVQSIDQSIQQFIDHTLQHESNRLKVDHAIDQPISIADALIKLQRGDSPTPRKLSTRSTGQSVHESGNQCASMNFLVFDLFTINFPCSCDPSPRRSTDQVNVQTINQFNKQSLLAQSIRAIGRSLSLAHATDRCLLIPSIDVSSDPSNDLAGDYSSAYFRSINRAVSSINQSNCTLRDIGLQLKCRCEQGRWAIESQSFDDSPTTNQSAAHSNHQSIHRAYDQSVKVVVGHARQYDFRWLASTIQSLKLSPNTSVVNQPIHQNTNRSIQSLSALDYIGTINYLVFQTINQSIRMKGPYRSLNTPQVVQSIDHSLNQLLNRTKPIMSFVMPISESFSLDLIARLIVRTVNLHSIDQLVITGSCSPLYQQSINRSNNQESIKQSISRCQQMPHNVQSLYQSINSLYQSSSQSHNLSIFVPHRFIQEPLNPLPQGLSKSRDASISQFDQQDLLETIDRSITQSISELALLSSSSVSVINHASEEGMLIAELSMIKQASNYPLKQSIDDTVAGSLSQPVHQPIAHTSQTSLDRTIHDLFGHNWMKGISEQSINPIVQSIKQSLDRAFDQTNEQTLHQLIDRADELDNPASTLPVDADIPADQSINQPTHHSTRPKLVFLFVAGIEGTGHHYIEQLIDQSIYQSFNPINQSAVIRERIIDQSSSLPLNESNKQPSDAVFYEDLFPLGHSINPRGLSDRFYDGMIGPSPGFLNWQHDRLASHSASYLTNQAPVNRSIAQLIERSKLIVDSLLTKYVWQFFASDRLTRLLNVKVRLTDRLTDLIEMYSRQLAQDQSLNSFMDDIHKPSVIIPVNMLGAPYGMQSYPNMDGPDKMMHHPVIALLDQMIRQVVQNQATKQTHGQSVDISFEVVLVDRLLDSSIDSTMKRRHGEEIGRHFSYLFQTIGLVDNLAYLNYDFQSIGQASADSLHNNRVSKESADEPQLTYRSNIVHMSLTELTREPWRFDRLIDQVIDRPTGASINRLVELGHSFKVDQSINHSLNQSMTAILLDQSVSQLEIVRERIYTQPQNIYQPTNQDRLIDLSIEQSVLRQRGQASDQSAGHMINYQCRSPHTMKRSLRQISRYGHVVFPFLTRLNKQSKHSPVSQAIRQSINPLPVTLVSLEGSGEDLVRWMIEQSLNLYTASVNPSLTQSVQPITQSLFTPFSKQSSVPECLIDQSIDWLTRDRVCLIADTRCSFDCDRFNTQLPVTQLIHSYDPEHHISKMFPMSPFERSTYQSNLQAIDQEMRWKIIDQMEGPGARYEYQQSNRTGHPSINQHERNRKFTPSEQSVSDSKDQPIQSDYIGSSHHPLIVLYRNPVDTLISTASSMLANHALHSASAKSKANAQSGFKHRVTAQAQRLIEEMSCFDELSRPYNQSADRLDNQLHEKASAHEHNWSNKSSIKGSFTRHRKSFMSNYELFLKTFPYRDQTINQSIAQSRRILYVRYEDLIHHPRSVLVQILKFMNVSTSQLIDQYSQQTVGQSVDCVIDRFHRLMEGASTSLCEINTSPWIQQATHVSNKQSNNYKVVDDMCGVATDSSLDRLVEQSFLSADQSIKRSIDRGHARGLRHLTGSIAQSNHHFPFKWLDLICPELWQSMLNDLGVSRWSSQGTEWLHSRNTTIDQSNLALRQLEQLGYLPSMQAMNHYISSAQVPKRKSMINSD